MDKKADVLEEERSKMDLVDEARLGTGSRIALAMANAHNILDSEDEKTNIAVEAAASEELLEMS